jgi:predicted Zn-dependent peptidase
MIVITLKNGVSAVIVPLKGMRAVTVEVMVKVGAKYESKQEAGLSHFLEHMAFKGTEKRPTSKDIFNEMDSLGVNYDAGTGYEDTSYQITTVRENLEWSLEMITDILFNSLLPAEEVVKERGVIMEEIKMYRDNPMMGMSAELTKFLYGGSGLGCWNISGEVEDIRQVERKDLISYRSKYFNPKETVVILAGNVNENDVEMLKQYFENKGEGRFLDLPAVEMKLTEQKMRRDKKEVEQGHLALAVPAFGSLDKRRYAFKLLDLIIAGNSSSRLFELLRSKMGWAYYVFPVSETLVEGGFWGRQAGVPFNKLEEAGELVEKEILKIKNEVSDDEVSRAKTYLKGKIELLLDRSDFWSGYVGSKLLIEGKAVSPEEELIEYGKVTAGEVADIAEEIFVKNNVVKYIISR